ncbi:hypothetical protein [Clostridium omnivorum]|uniref:Uncharacterized protein n=1 Tax=Clostridium omnivorum TaxID=1604902 RepID=A0ABQ5N969_9CLOT|nr:hypothetical protein [Clostridium sp. E14]GLC31727.1 hypothetical protein bsdE14_31370 [Clostridium sp. E14]
MNEDENKNITDGSSFFTENNVLKRREIIYLIKVFGLSVLLFFIIGGGSNTTTYFLSLISSVLIINGYSRVKKENS